MRSRFLLPLLAALLHANAAPAEPSAHSQHVPGTAKAWVRHTRAGDTFITEDASFQYLRLLHDDGQTYTQMLVWHTDRNESTGSQEVLRGSVKAIGWTIPHPHQRHRLWQIRAPGNSAHPLPDIGMLEISNNPCCGQTYQNTYFSLLNGKRLYATNGAPDKGFFGQDAALVRIDGGYDGSRYTKSRYIGFGSASASTDDSPALQYGSGSEIFQRIFLEGHNHDDNLDVPSLAIVQPGGQPSNYIDVQGPFTCTIVLTFPDGPEVRIPVEDDVVRTDLATLPPGYELRQQPFRFALARK